jgi:hypothetical protein
MLSQAMRRYVDLHRSLGFRFRIQHSLLRNFVAFAEAYGDEVVRIDRALDWAARAPSPSQRRSSSLSGALRWRCSRRTPAMRCPRPMPWGMRGSNGELRIFIDRMRSLG